MRESRQASSNLICVSHDKDTRLRGKGLRDLYNSIRLIGRGMYSFKGAGFRPRYDVERNDVTWLGLRAYRRVLLKKNSKHKSLLFFFLGPS
ncbi:telomerase reverse transcriptase-like [Salvia splendens]|uniref:telomerase reverse transcriptase-like n=1 Tax=Salvia splendens TaxID=180675 RepID=UPI001C2703EB|nr:telomerase reverse transcriptase-like [Salvia splendens]